MSRFPSATNGNMRKAKIILLFIYLYHCCYFQEAEQRRLEQQDRIMRQKPEVAKFSSQSSKSHFNQVKSNFSSNNHPHHQHANVGNANSNNNEPELGPQITSYRPSVHQEPPPPPKWEQQVETYQPSPTPPGAGPATSHSNNKPLPDAIINTITQRVKNKANK